MSFKGLGKKSKRILAFLLAAALFFNAWIDYDFSVLAEGEDPEAAPAASWEIELSPENGAVYTGNDLTPAVTVKDADGNVIPETENYTVTWMKDDIPVDEIINAGEYTVTVTGAGEGEKAEEKFIVDKANLSTFSMYISGTEVNNDYVDYVYNGEEQKPANDAITIKKGEHTLEENVDYTLAITGNTNAGKKITIIATAKDDSNYTTDKLSKEITIQKKTLTTEMFEITGVESLYTYKNEKLEPIVTVTVDGKPWTKDDDYAVSYGENIKGTGSVAVKTTTTGTWSKNYTDCDIKTITFEINPIDAGNANIQYEETLLAEKMKDWYAVPVELKAEGYQISTDEKTWKDKLDITADNDGNITYYLKNDNGISGRKEVEIYVDTTAPEITDIAGPAEGWAQSKIVEFKVTEDDHDGDSSNGNNLWKVYYTLGDKKEDVTANAEGKYTITIDEEILGEETKTLTITAVNKAGLIKTKTITVKEIDNTKPTFAEGVDGGECWTNKDIEVPLGVTDSGSGVVSVVVEPEVEGVEVKEEDGKYIATFSATEEGTIVGKFKVIDDAGNDSIATYTVKVDKTKPSINIETLIDKQDGEPAYSNSGVYWFGNSEVTIPVKITGETITSAPYKVIYSKSLDFSNYKESENKNEDGTVEFDVNLSNESLTEGNITYYIKAVDDAGNESEPITTINLGLDEKPTVSDLSVKGISGTDSWIKSKDLVDGKLQFKINVEKASTDIKYIEYKEAKSSDYTQLNTNDFTVDGNGYTFCITSPEDNTGYSYEVRTISETGLTSEPSSTQIINVDKTAPETDAYIQFFSDVVGDNKADTGETSTGSWISQILNMANTAWNKIWGNTKIDFEVYVRDGMSGIANIKMSYEGKLIENLTKVTGLQAFTEEITDSKESMINAGYTVYQGSIWCNKNETLEIKDFKIDSITDVAGNITSDIVLGATEGVPIIYLDSVTPKLKVSAENIEVKNENFAEGTTYYTNSSEASITLTIEERFFAEKEYPIVILEKKAPTENDWTTVSNIEETWEQIDNFQWKKKFQLENIVGEEIEYRIRLEEYSDPSGNVLEGETSAGITTNVTDGSYTSSTFVVDGIAPKLTYSVSGNSDCAIGVSTVYNNIGDKDLEVTVVIDDTPKYFEQGNLEVNIVNVEDANDVISLINENTSSSVVGDTHTYKLNCDEKIAGNKEFYVQVQYTDKAGNKMGANEEENSLENGMSVNNEGVYTSKTYIIDNVAPKFSVAYDKVSRIVSKSGEIWTEEEGATPQANRDAYFKEGIDVTFTVDEKYTNVTGNVLEHHKLQIIKDGNTEEPVYSSIIRMNDEAAENVSGDDNNVAVSWSKTGTIYAAKVTIPVNAEHTTDGEYQIIFASEDCAGNKMTVENTDDVSVKDLFTNDTYTSPKLILDSKAPETDAHIIFTSDVEGDNQWTDNTLSMNDTEGKEIWGRREINFEVYVRDTFSGVKRVQSSTDNAQEDSIEMSYNDGAVKVELTEGETKKIIDRIEYTVYKGSLTCDEKTELVIEDLKIDWIKDVAGNSITEPIAFEGTIYLDDVSPKLEVGYNDAFQIVNNTTWESGENNTPQNGYTAYYDSNIEVTLTVSENSTKAVENNDGTVQVNALEHHKLQIFKDGNATPVYSSEIGMNDNASSIAEEENASTPISVEWKKENNIYTAKITIKADQIDHTTDGDYQIVFQSKDCTGNLMEAKDAADVTVKDLLTGGTYTSPLLVIDTTAPELSVSCNGTPVQTKTDKDGNERKYFNESVALNITVKDRNIRYSELISGFESNDGEIPGLESFKALTIENKSITNNVAAEQIDNMTKMSGIRATGSDEVHSWKVNLSLATDANYTIPINFCDLAGNRATGYTEYVTVDSTAPEVIYRVINYLSDDHNLISKDGEDTVGVKYDRGGSFFEEIGDKFLHFFFKNSGGMQIGVTAKDDISGVANIQYQFEKGAGKVVTADTPMAKMEETISIDSSFKDQVLVWAEDYSSNNTGNAKKVGAFVVESNIGTIAFDDSGTSAKREEGNEKFYNTDVNMKVTFEDKGSGVDKYEVRFDEKPIGNMQYSYKENAKGATITDNYVASGTITTSEYNKNKIMVSASMTDNAGNSMEKECETIYNIDVTKPTIEVTYDNNAPANEMYYNKARIATIKITERNFDEKDVKWLITSTDGPQPTISGWSHSGEDDDSNVHTCTVTFEEDSDYTFTLEFEDKAGNKAEYSKIDEFTIDKTLPVMEVSYDNNDFLNEYYYNATRTATIDILEHNFDPNGVQVNVTADNAAGGAIVSGWSRNGDHNIATVTFANDAEYTLDIEGVDLAENELEDYEQDHFVVDKTVPELEIYDIENLSANKGEVRPGIRYYDTNYDAEGTVVIFKGYHNGEQEMDGDKSLQANGLELKLHDIPHVQSNDDVYTMEATVYDLAGNSSEASVMFSVNRFGSVYTFDQATNELVGDEGKYYTNEVQDIVIVETNVDTLEFKEITCNLNGKLSTLKEGEDFDVYLDGTEATWKQYTYRIFAENFEEEGTYIITTYSEDKATNTSDNNSKGKSVEFVLDKTNPSVLISGVEDGGQYREDKHEMTLDIEDNIRVAEVLVDINGETTRFDTAQVNELDGKITMDIESDNQWQEIKVTVEDAAGNRTVSDTLSVLVTANLLVQFISNQIVLYTTVGIIGVGVFVAWWFIFRKKKKIGEA